MLTPSIDEIIAGIRAFQEKEQRDAMYKIATFIVRHFWGKPSEMADGLGVLLLTWNQAFYRYGRFDFDLLEQCISSNLHILQDYRRRDIADYTVSDDLEIKKLFEEFLEALRIRKDGEPRARSPVSTSKALHLLAPRFFPIWDMEISKAYGCSYSSNPASKYILFLSKQKKIISAIDVDRLQGFGDKTPLKLLDELNYAKFTKRWIRY